jgi:hypothetical protein
LWDAPVLRVKTGPRLPGSGSRCWPAGQQNDAQGSGEVQKTQKKDRAIQSREQVYMRGTKHRVSRRQAPMAFNSLSDTREREYGGTRSAIPLPEYSWKEPFYILPDFFYARFFLAAGMIWPPSRIGAAEITPPR